MDRQDPDTPTTDAPELSWRPSAVVIVIILATLLVELTLTAADHGLIGRPRWRGLAYQNGAFWSGLLDNWRANYPAQPWTMFLTYSLLHSGLSHLAGNMAMLYMAGRTLVPRTGQMWFAVIYVVSAIGGGIGFALLNSSAQPMVGASGAIFGLGGAWIWQDWYLASRSGQNRRTLIGVAAALFLLNLLHWYVQNGQVAWEAHLGGFLAGWFAATLLIPRHDSATI
ncbi:rhomboid family intramembrane serine protease [Arenibacterium sp. CAU 1754]